MSAMGQKRTSNIASNATTTFENGLRFDLLDRTKIGDPVLC